MVRRSAQGATRKGSAILAAVTAVARRPTVCSVVSALVMLAGACLIFGLSFVLRYNEPEGGYAGLLDDHFFYLVRGWQMLFGELPDRDFVDIGAPLTYVLSWLMQLALGRGTWSEVVLCTAMLSAAAALTWWAAVRSSGSFAAGLLGAVFAVCLYPRFYNYPKVIVYALIVPATWTLIDRPTWPRRLTVAAITIAGLLFRHDHGFFVGAFVCATWLLVGGDWRVRFREVLIYGCLCFLLVAPYLVYLQANGGIVPHFVTANAWSMRDRARAPLRWPTFETVSNEASGASVGAVLRDLLGSPFSFVSRNLTTWLFHLLISLPLLALGAVGVKRDAWRPGWPHARAKIAGVALLGILLNVGFLRGALEARLADVSVPQSILIAWLMASAVRALWSAASVNNGRPVARVAALVVSIVALAVGVVTSVALLKATRGHADVSALLKGPGPIVGRLKEMTGRLQGTWPLERWTSRESKGPVRLMFYLSDCTAPTDFVFISQYLPQVPALAQRAFAGGHPDLRPGFFGTRDDQQLLLTRMRRQHVPVLIVPPADAYSQFESEFPLVARYFAESYKPIGDRDLGDGLRVAMWMRKSEHVLSQYEPLDLPCFR
jgi:hypothetical protein